MYKGNPELSSKKKNRSKDTELRVTPKYDGVWDGVPLRGKEFR